MFWFAGTCVVEIYRCRNRTASQSGRTDGPCVSGDIGPGPVLLSCQSHHYHHYHHYLHQALGNQAIRGAAHVGFSEKVLTLSQADIYTPSLYVYMIAKINIIITIIVIRQGQCFCSALPSLNHHCCLSSHGSNSFLSNLFLWLHIYIHRFSFYFLIDS